MLKEIEFLKNEKEKLQNVLKTSTGKNYKQYATILQAYLTISSNLSQLENYQRQLEKEEKEEEERRKIIEEAEKEIEAEKETEKE